MKMCNQFRSNITTTNGFGTTNSLNVVPIEITAKNMPNPISSGLWMLLTPAMTILVSFSTFSYHFYFEMVKIVRPNSNENVKVEITSNSHRQCLILANIIFCNSHNAHCVWHSIVLPYYRCPVPYAGYYSSICYDPRAWDVDANCVYVNIGLAE